MMRRSLLALLRQSGLRGNIRVHYDGEEGVETMEIGSDDEDYEDDADLNFYDEDDSEEEGDMDEDGGTNAGDLESDSLWEDEEESTSASDAVEGMGSSRQAKRKGKNVPDSPPKKQRSDKVDVVRKPTDSLLKILSNRERGASGPKAIASMCRLFIPRSVATLVEQFHAKPYCGQFSKDGSLYYTATQDFKIHLYNTRLDLSTGYDYRWEQFPGVAKAHPADGSVKTFTGHKVLRTLIRCHFSSDATSQRYV
ncbi:DDB1- and CUL4-associated factor 11, partial [Chytridiales sp. JEL 0842]